MAQKQIEQSRNLMECSVGEAKSITRSLIEGLAPQDCPSIVTIGPVGIGKTQIWEQLAKEAMPKGYEKHGMSVIVRHLSQVHPLDLAGIGLDNNKREMYFAAPPLYTEVMSMPAPRLLVLDEIDRMAPIAQSAALQILSEKKLNGYKLEDTYIVAAGNAWHAQYTFEFDKAMASRLCMLHVMPKNEEWLEWAAQNGIDSRIIITVASAPDVLNQHDEKTEGAMKVADPRAWHNLSKALKGGLPADKAAMFVGNHAATTFMRYANFAHDWSKQIAQVASGKLLTLPASVKAAEKQAVEFGIYLAAAGAIKDIPTARNYLINGCEQIGDERTYIASKLLTYNIPVRELSADPKIQEIHLRIRKATYNTD